MRLLLLAPACDGEDVGEAYVAYQWARGLSERHPTTVLTLTHTPGHVRRQLPNAEVVEWTPPRLPARLERFTSLAKPDYVYFHRQVKRYLQETGGSATRRFDLAHQPVPVGMRYPSPLVGAGLPWILGPVGGGLSDPPGFADERETAPWYTKLRRLDAWRLHNDPWLRRTYESADVVLGIAPYVEEALTGVHVRRLEIMPDVAVAELPPQPSDLGVGSTPPLKALFVGRVIRTKGVRYAIQALAQVDGVTLDVVGDGPDRRTCEDLVATLGLAERVRFHGWLPRAEVEAHFHAAHAFVFPSFREPGGTVVFEALSHGLPLVVADRGGPTAAVDDHCAIRVPVNTPAQFVHDLAGALRALQSDDRRTAMGSASRERASTVGLWSAKIDRMEGLMRELLSRE